MVITIQVHNYCQYVVLRLYFIFDVIRNVLFNFRGNEKNNNVNPKLSSCLYFLYSLTFVIARNQKRDNMFSNLRNL